MAPRGALPADDRQAAPQPVECARCAVTVHVVKFSPQHTSVQWTAAAAGGCLQFRDQAAAGTRGGPAAGCPALRDSVEAAVAAGLLTVSPPWYERTPSDERVPSDPRKEDSARLPPGGRGEGDPRDRRRVLDRA